MRDRAKAVWLRPPRSPPASGQARDPSEEHAAHPLLPGERSHLSVGKYSLQTGQFQTLAVPVRRRGVSIGWGNLAAGAIRSMFGGGTAGDAAGMEAAVITIFVVAVVLVGVIALREFGRRR